jgi:hypothetical protein
MSTWSGTADRTETEALARYTAKDITNSKDLGKELSQIERDQSLNFVDKYKQKKQLVRTALIAKQQLDLMKSLGLSHSDEIAATLIRSGELLTSKIREVNASDMEEDIKKNIYTGRSGKRQTTASLRV